MSPIIFWCLGCLALDVFSEAQMRLNDHSNIKGILQGYYKQQCASMIFLAQGLQVAIFTLILNVALLYRLQYSMRKRVYGIYFHD